MGGLLLARLARMLMGRTLAVIESARAVLSVFVQLSAGMFGLFLTKLTPLRVGVSAACVLVWLALAALGFHPTLGLALLVFVTLYVWRFAFLFFSFVPGGFAPWLTGRYGSERGYAIYEAVTAAFFFFRTLSFIWLLDATYMPATSAAEGLFVAIGAIWLAVGVLINLWAVQTVGLGSYYYRDLFLGERQLDFKREGPYELMDNPMYGLGQLAAYGAALIALSPIGVFAVAQPAHPVRLQLAHRAAPRARRAAPCARALAAREPRQRARRGSRRVELRAEYASSGAADAERGVVGVRDVVDGSVAARGVVQRCNVVAVGSLREATGYRLKISHISVAFQSRP
jgi:hypothetical protein